MLAVTLEEISLVTLEASAIELLEMAELSTLEATLLEDAFEDDFTDEMAFEELPVETGGFELLPPPQALSTTVSEKAVRALNVYELKFSIVYLCCVKPHA